jgi:3-hydroxyisobutyrate dehydrogenase
MTDTSIGFIGIGNMGWPMASNLVRAGRRVIVFDTDRERAGRFCAEHQGARHAPTLGELGQSAGVVITMLPTGVIVRRVMLEDEGGLAQTLAAGSLLIDMSSSDPIGTRELGEALKKYHIQFVDAPVSGGVPGARDATLAIMIGSDDQAAIARAAALLNLLGKRLFETGPLGSGHAMKSLNNYVAATGFAAASEALIVGARFGLTPAVMLQVLNASTGRNFSTEHSIGPQVLAQAFASGFALALLAKDVKIAADLAAGLGLNMPFTRLTSEQFLAASASLGPGRDFTEIFKYWQSMATAK